MRTGVPRRSVAAIAAVASVMLLTLTGCSGLTNAGLRAAQSHGTSGDTGSTGAGSTGSAKIAVSSTSLNFGNVAAGSTSTQQVTITNTGAINVAVTENAAVGPGFDASGIGSGLILSPTQSATLEVSFTPAAVGAASGSVPLLSDVWSSPVVIALTGTGVQTSVHVATLAWDGNSSIVAGYNAYRATQSGGPYTRLNSSLLSNTSYSDTTVASGQVYHYVVTSVNSGGVESDYSNEVSATIP